jgi:hypothetical protein
LDSSPINSTIPGGFANRIYDYSKGGTIGGGSYNEIKGCSSPHANQSIIGGGCNNTISCSSCSFIGGGEGNQICNAYSSGVSSGRYNVVKCYTSIISGGYFNHICSNYSHIGGGYNNKIYTNYHCSGILGGRSNIVNHTRSFIVGANITTTADCTTFTNNLCVAGTACASGNMTANDFITTSDRNLKSNIKEIENGLDVIKQFAAYEYEKEGRQDAGFIAQEVAEVIPYAVFTDDKGMLSMSDRPVLAHMHKAIVELERRLKSIEDKLN